MTLTFLLPTLVDRKISNWNWRHRKEQGEQTKTKSKTKPAQRVPCDAAQAQLILVIACWPQIVNEPTVRP